MSMQPPPPPSPAGGAGGAVPPAINNPLIDYWKLVVLQRYAKFDGRARRAEYWWFTLGDVIIFVVLGILVQVSNVFFVVYLIAALALIVPGLAVTIRRLHDTDKSGWFVLFALIPFVGGLILLVFMLIDSTRGTNQYGTSEKYPV
ncbi:MAG: DUF805 domain-containing protein [Acidimicrobiia bacterium]